MQTMLSKVSANSNNFVGAFDFSDKFMRNFATKENNLITHKIYLPEVSYGFSISNFLTPLECLQIGEEANSHDWIPVGISGMKSNFNIETDAIGSYRTSSYNEVIAQRLFKRIRPYLHPVYEMNNLTPTDWDNHLLWEPVGVSPLFRFIKYEDQGLLIPHYDAPFIYSEDTRTLQSMIVYLNNPEEIIGGATRFLEDEQINIPLNERNYEDWSKLATPADVRFQIQPEMGKSLIFYHRVLHDSEPVKGTGVKLLLRTDIIFKKITDNSYE